MTYTGLEMFMDNLKQLIDSHDNPVINNYPSISYERHQFQRLFEDLESIIKTFSIHQDQNLQEFKKVKDLKRRFKDAAEEAHVTVDLFLSAVNFRYIGYFTRPEVYKTSLNLEGVMRSIKSIKDEFTVIIHGMKMDSSLRLDQHKMHSSADGSSCTIKPSQSRKVLEDVFVGFVHDAELIRDKLTDDQKQLDVVSIVGMGGLGKTTLATKVFNDHFVVYHFHIRAWVTVSQTYDRQDFLIKVLSSIGVEVDLQKLSNSRLREVLHKTPMGNRYLIVIDDIWSCEAWNDLKLLFPNNNTGSRILLTSRLKEVALHANSHGLIHHLQYLTEQDSWELLCKKVFQGEECPKWMIEPGMQIARNCHGLPLAVVVIAGILVKEPMSKFNWEKIAQSVSSYLVQDQKGYLETLALSFDHLPPYLRDCFLYLGGFPEDYKFTVSRLIWLWVAEGFIHTDRNQCLEDIAEDFLLDLVDRNLLIVAERNFNGGVKACTIHDVLRELCLEKAKEENFFLKVHKPGAYYPVEVLTDDKVCRIFTHNDDLHIMNHLNPQIPCIRSLLLFHRNASKIFSTYAFVHQYALLRVMDLGNCVVVHINFPKVIALLVHLQYMAIWYPSRSFPSSICNLWKLQTLIFRTDAKSLVLPNTISNLVNLRHLWSHGDIYFPAIKKPMNLKTISRVKLGDEVECWSKCFPGIKKLTCILNSYEENDFESLAYLETLKITGVGSRRTKSTEIEFPNEESKLGKSIISFPASLKKLTLKQCYLPWSDMSIVQSLPSLEVLKVLDNAFVGPIWDTGEKEFRQLKFLKLQGLKIRQWDAYSFNFPHLKQLMLAECKDLEEIPIELGDIATLELIEVDESSSSVVESLNIIEEEQHNVGNYELKISIRKNSKSPTCT